jgi:hypothetical protein
MREIPTLQLLLLVATIVFTAAAGTLCVFWPERVAAYERKKYHRSNKFIQKWPFFDMVLLPWYPTYLRCMGVFLWLFALAITSLFVLAK